MVFDFIRFQFLKAVRSVSLARNLVAGFFLLIFGFLVLSSLSLTAFALPHIIREIIGEEEVISFLNAHLVFFFALEVLYRFFLQKLPVIELENFLHLPIRKSKIIHFILGRSFISITTLAPFLIFLPFTFMEVVPAYGSVVAFYWFGTVTAISWTLHWVILWYKHRYGNDIVGIVSIFAITFVAIGSAYYGWFNLGSLATPFFDSALTSPIPLIVAAGLFAISYRLAFSFYKRNAYIEELESEKNARYSNRSMGFLSRFGLTGEIADIEWRLILRHKKSKSYLVISFLFLFYGLYFYTDPAFQTETGFSYFYIFVGIFVTGIFIVQYGQLFLSWNSASFDFYLCRENGLRSLIKGKYLLFLVISLLCFLLSTPYAYFGWDILFVHTATFLFNMGVSIHIISYIALWQPKPMDLDKGAFFNYEGVGVAQFLMGIPIFVIPYVIFVPAAILVNDYFGLFVLGAIGSLGIVFHEKLIDLSVQKLIRNRHKISSSFRQET